LIIFHRRKPTRYLHRRQWLRKWWTCWSRRTPDALPYAKEGILEQMLEELYPEK